MTRSTCRSIFSTDGGRKPSSPYWRRSSKLNAVPLLRTGSFSSATPCRVLRDGALAICIIQFLLCFSGWTSVGWIADCSRNWQDGKRAHALCAMDKHTLDIRRRGWTGVEAGIMPVAELGAAIGVVQVDDKVVGIEEHDQVLREVGDSVDAEVCIAQEDGAGLRDGERCSDDGKIDIRQISWRADVSDIPVARDLRHGRAHDFGVRDLRPYRR